MQAEILAVGSEITSGQRLDTNSQWLATRLGELGITTRHITAVDDDLERETEAIRIAATRADLVVVGGGLGPTQDDLTRDALARFAGVELIECAESLAAIESMFARRNRAMPERNRVQALLPRGAEALPNSIGTAPGIWFTYGASRFICLPGVPKELHEMFVREVVPRLGREGLARGVIVHRVINLFGKGESEVEMMAMDLTVRGRVPEVGITAHDATISLRVSAHGANESDALAEIEPTLATIRERFRDFVLAEGTADVADALVAALRQSVRTLAVAESCTGGRVAAQITAIPDVSSVFLGGVVSYANEVKAEMLGVPRELIASRGAVSPEVAQAMARGVRERTGADLGLSITGIAGPAGGSAEKPVGLVFLGLAHDRGVESRELRLGPEQPRDVIQGRAAKHAMNWARLHLIKQDREGTRASDSASSTPRADRSSG
jgi:nicotinamide-nucleotide amidase